MEFKMDFHEYLLKSYISELTFMIEGLQKYSSLLVEYDDDEPPLLMQKRNLENAFTSAKSALSSMMKMPAGEDRAEAVSMATKLMNKTRKMYKSFEKGIEQDSYGVPSSTGGYDTESAKSDAKQHLISLIDQVIDYDFSDNFKLYLNKDMTFKSNFYTDIIKSFIEKHNMSSMATTALRKSKNKQDFYDRWLKKVDYEKYGDSIKSVIKNVVRSKLSKKS